MVTVLLIPACGTGAYGLHVYRSGNFHVVTDGLAYRSAQLNAEDLEKRIEEYGIKTVLNLREWDNSMVWYQKQKAMALRNAVEHHNFALSEYVELSPQQLAKLVTVLETSPKPILIHCAGGADRTSLVSALFRYRFEQAAVESCVGEFSLRYGHVPLLRPKVQAMQKSFWRYVDLNSKSWAATQAGGNLETRKGAESYSPRNK